MARTIILKSGHLNEARSISSRLHQVPVGAYFTLMTPNSKEPGDVYYKASVDQVRHFISGSYYTIEHIARSTGSGLVPRLVRMRLEVEFE